MALDPREFEQFVTQAMIKLPGASESGIKAELYDVLKEFFEDSNCWTEDIQFVPLANVTDYTLAPREDGQIIRLVGTWDDKGIPVPAFMRDFAVVKMLHAPQNSGDAEHKWFSRVVKTVTLPTTRDAVPIAPTWTLKVYSIHVLDGLLGKMMGQQSKSYSNTTMAAYHLKRFRTGIQIARTAAARANNVGAQEWAYPRGWGTGSQRGGVSTAWPTRAF